MISSSNLLAPTPINIDGGIIHQDKLGRFCLNDLHQASGGEQKKQPRYFLENKQTQDLVQALVDSGIPLSPVEVVSTILYQIKDELFTVKEKSTALCNAIFASLERLIHIAEYLADNHSNTFDVEREKYEMQWEATKNG